MKKSWQSRLAEFGKRHRAAMPFVFLLLWAGYNLSAMAERMSENHKKNRWDHRPATRVAAAVMVLVVLMIQLPFTFGYAIDETGQPESSSVQQEDEGDETEGENPLASEGQQPGDEPDGSDAGTVPGPSGTPPQSPPPQQEEEGGDGEEAPTATEPFTVTGFEELPGEVLRQSRPALTLLEDLELPETLLVTVETAPSAEGEPPQAETREIEVSWQAQPAYNPAMPGDYVFAPVLPESAVLAEGVQPPQITVTLTALRPGMRSNGFYYVNPAAADDSGNGDVGDPLKTLETAITKASQDSASTVQIILVDDYLADKLYTIHAPGKTIAISSDNSARVITRGVAGDLFTVTGGTLRIAGVVVDGGGTGGFSGAGAGGGALVKLDGGNLILGTDGVLRNNKSSVNGGAVYLASNSRVTMDEGTIASNTTTQHGGALYMTAGTTFEMNGGIITENAAGSGYGGAVYLEGAFGSETKIVIKGGTASKNSADLGGAIYLIYGELTLGAAAIIDENEATTSGGGVYLSDDSTAVMGSGSIISNNTASGGDGGGVYLASSPQLAFTMNGGVISDNTAGNRGGGIFVSKAFDSDAPLTINQGRIERNSATNGGGLYIDNGVLRLYSGTIAANIKASGGKGADIFYKPDQDFGAVYFFGGTVGNDSGGFYIEPTNPSDSSVATHAARCYIGAGFSATVRVELDLVGFTIATFATGFSGDKQAAAEGFTGTPDALAVGELNEGKTGVVLGSPDPFRIDFMNGGTVVKKVFEKTFDAAFVTAINPASGLNVGAYDAVTVYQRRALVAVNEYPTQAVNFLGKSLTVTYASSDFKNNVYHTLDYAGELFSVEAGQTFILKDIIYDASGNAEAAVIPVNGSGAKFELQADATLIGGNGYGVQVAGGGSFVMGGGTLKNCGGYGVYITNGSATFSGGTLTGCVGGVRLDGSNASLALAGTTITGNGAANGVRIEAGATFTMTAGTISGHTAGGVWAETGSVTLSGGEISGNSTAGNGAGVYIAGTATLSLASGGTGISIKNNQLIAAGGKGAGIYYAAGADFAMPAGTVELNRSAASGVLGGGIYIVGVNASFAGGVVSQNSLTGGTSQGGGIYFDDNSAGKTLTIDGATISGNAAVDGGGVFVKAGELTITSGTLSGNTASGTGAANGGGGVYITAGTFTFSGGAIGGTNSALRGGGIYLAGTAVLTMSGSSTAITGNTATSGGAGAGLYVGDGASFTLNDGIISGNVSGGNGGGIYFDSTGTLSLAGGVVGDATTPNTATTSGGGVYIGQTATATSAQMGAMKISGNTAANGGGVYVAGTATFTMTSAQSVISQNTATTEGGGVYVAGSATLLMQNGIIGSETDGEGNRGTLRGGGVYLAGTFTITTGNITGNTVGNSGFGGAVYLAGSAVFTVNGGNVGQDFEDNGVARPGTQQISMPGTLTPADATVVLEGPKAADNVFTDWINFLAASEPATAEGKNTFAGIFWSRTSADKALIGTWEPTNYIFKEASIRVDVYTGGSVSESRYVASLRYAFAYINNKGGGASGANAKYDIVVLGDIVSLANLSGDGSKLNKAYIDVTIKPLNPSSPITITVTDHTAAHIFVVEQNQILRFENIILAGNTAGTGSLVHVNGGALYTTGTNLTGNTASGDGGAVYITSGSYQMSGGEISGNTAGGNGGAVYLATGSFTVQDGELTGNTAVAGGGVYVAGGSFTLQEGEITGNTATGAEGYDVSFAGAAGSTFTLYSGTVGTQNSGTNEVKGIKLAADATITIPKEFDKTGTAVYIETTGHETKVAKFNSDVAAATKADAAGCFFSAYYDSGVPDFKPMFGEVWTESSVDYIIVALARSVKLYTSSDLGATWSFVRGFDDLPAAMATLQNNSYAKIEILKSQATGKVALAANANINLTLTSSTGIYTLTRSEDGGALITVNTGNTLTLKNIELDGQKATYTDAGGALVDIIDGSLFIETGATLKDNATSTNGGGISASGMSYLELEGGILSGNEAVDGAGIYMGGGGFNMNGGAIYANTASGNGGGIYLGSDVTLALSAGTIGGTANTAASGGGIYAAARATLRITVAGGSANAAITANTATSGNGGGICAVGATLDFATLETSKTFSVSGNTAAASGGGIYAQNTELKTGALEGSFLIQNNTATAGNGGGIFFNGDETLTLVGATIGGTANGNTAALGGGLYITGLTAAHPATLKNNTVSGNTGGGIYWAGGGSLQVNATNITNNTLATGTGAGLYATALPAAPATLTFVGACAITGNTATAGSGGGLALDGAVTASGGTLTLQGNTAGASGGGGYLNDGARFIMAGGAIGGSGSGQGNTAGTSGGGIYQSSTAALAELNGVTVEKNAAITSGGGIYAGGGQLALIGGTLVTGNTGASGSGVYLENSATLYIPKAKIGQDRSDNALYTDAATVYSSYTDTSAAAHNFSVLDTFIFVQGAVSGAPLPDTFNASGPARNLALLCAAGKNGATDLVPVYGSGPDTLIWGTPVVRVQMSAFTRDMGDLASALLVIPSGIVSSPTVATLLALGDFTEPGSISFTGYKAVTFKSNGSPVNPYVVTLNTASVSGGFLLNVENLTLAGGVVDLVTVAGSGELTLGTDGTLQSGGTGVVVNTTGAFTLAGGNITAAQNAVRVAGGSFTISSGEIKNNTLAGAAVKVTGGSFAMAGGEISGNTAARGAVDVTGGSFTLSGGSIKGNTGGSGGAGVYLQGPATFAMAGGEVSGNLAGSSPQDVLLSSGVLTLKNGVIGGATGGLALAGTGSVAIADDFVATGTSVRMVSTAYQPGGVMNFISHVLDGNKQAAAPCFNARTLGGELLVGGVENNIMVWKPVSIILREGGVNDRYYATLQLAANDASTTVPSTIVVTGNLGTQGMNVAADKDITLVTEGFATDPFLLTRSGTGHLFGVAVGGKLTLKNVTIDGGGSAAAGSLVKVEGTLAIESGTTLQNNNATGGSAGDGYSAVFVAAGGSATMAAGSAIKNNTGSHGGGVTVYGASATFAMAGGEITGNTATDNGGGVMAAAGGTFTMNGGALSGNNAVGAGGGVRVETGGTFTLSGGTLTGNLQASVVGNDGSAIDIATGGTLALSGSPKVGTGLSDNAILNNGTINITGVLTAALIHMDGADTLTSFTVATKTGGGTLTQTEARYFRHTGTNKRIGNNSGSNVVWAGPVSIPVNTFAATATTVTFICEAPVAELLYLQVGDSLASLATLELGTDYTAAASGAHTKITLLESWLTQNPITSITGYEVAVGYLSGYGSGNGPNCPIELYIGSTGPSYHPNLSLAIATVDNGETATIKVTADITDAQPVTVDGGKKITIESDVPGTARMVQRGSGNAGDLFTVTGSGSQLTFRDITVDGGGAGGGGTLLAVANGAVASLADGTTLQNNTNNSGGANINGGAVRVTGGSTLNLQPGTGGTIVIQGNTAVGYGGGIYADNAQNKITIAASGASGLVQIDDNTANSGGGIYLGGSTVLNASASGGAALEVTGNTAANGGGIYQSGGTGSVSGATIIGNTATAGNGGGVYVGNGSFNLSGSALSGNDASAGNGGGLYMAGGSGTITGGTVGGTDPGAGNTAGGNGGGISVEGGASLILQNGAGGNTLLVEGNTATGYGDGVITGGSAGLTINSGSIGTAPAAGDTTLGNGLYFEKDNPPTLGAGFGAATGNVNLEGIYTGSPTSGYNFGGAEAVAKVIAGTSYDAMAEAAGAMNYVNPARNDVFHAVAVLDGSGNFIIRTVEDLYDCYILYDRINPKDVFWRFYGTLPGDVVDSVEVENTLLPTANYTVAAGSIVITLDRAAYLPGLAEAIYALDVYMNGASGTPTYEYAFIVKHQPTGNNGNGSGGSGSGSGAGGGSGSGGHPQTGDASSMWLWVLLSVFSGVAITITCLWWYKKPQEEEDEGEDMAG